MDSSNEASQGIAATRLLGDNEQSSWGAAGSLRAHTHTQGASEQSPLLGDAVETDERRPSTWDGEEDFAYIQSLKWWRRPAVAWLLPPFFLFAVAIGGIVVPKLNLILSLVCRDYYMEKARNDPDFIFTPILLGGSNPQCRSPEIQSLVTEFTLTLTMITGIISAIVAPKLGDLSDRYGRCLILLISSFGALSGEIFTIIVATFPDTVNYRWLIIGSILDGLSGSFTLGMAISYAYASDCTPPPKRAVAFGYFHACLFGGIAVGPLFIAFLYRYTENLLTIFYIALGVHVFFMLFVFLVVPESLSKKRQLLAREKHAALRDAIARGDTSWRGSIYRANPFEPLKILWPTGPGTSPQLRYNLVLLASVDNIMFGVAMGAVTVVIYYTGFQFGWETDDTSIFISIVNIVRVSALVIGLPLLSYVFRTLPSRRERKRSGVDLPVLNTGSDNLDLWTIRFALVAEFVGYLGYALSRTGSAFTFAGVITSLGGVGSPTLQSSLTKHVPHEKVGSLLGTTGLLHASARVYCPLIFNLIYAKTVGKYTQAVFLVLSSCFAVGLIASFGIRPNVYLHEPFAPDSETVIPPNSPRPDHNPAVMVDEEIVGV